MLKLVSRACRAESFDVLDGHLVQSTRASARRLSQWVRALGILALVALVPACDTRTPKSKAPAPTTPAPVVVTDSSEPTAGTCRVTGQESHSFEYRPPADKPKPTSVSIAGDFNGWSSTANPMALEGDVFRATLKLDRGVHNYKFVLNGGEWTPDPNGDKDLQQPDGYGGYNSAVLVGADGRRLPPPQPDRIYAPAIAHDPESDADCNVVSNDLVRLTLRTQANDITSACVLIADAGGSWKRRPLSLASSAYGFDYFSGIADISAPQLRYVFELKDGSATRYEAGGKLYPSEPSAQAQAYTRAAVPKFQTPDWAKHAVWYQIFPERFRNGEPANDPPNTMKWTSKWFSALPGESGVFYNDVWGRRYGGDFQGIKQQLPYLRELGVTAIYLNPVFEAEDMHKYDTSDYRHVDDNFGFKGDIAELTEGDDPASWKWSKTDRLFLDFIADAHRQGFKVIIDGVFNHVGRKHYAFQDVVKNGKSSRYADWFDVRDWNAPIKYIAWDRGGDPSSDGALPVFRKDGKLGLVHGPREHIMAITRRWLAPDGDPSKGVDGIRLDVPQDIPHPFWVDWRKLVKDTKPDAYITGEIWGMAQPWLEGDQFDAVMNYQFAMATQGFFVNVRTQTTSTAFSQRLSQLVRAYPFQVALVQQNLFDSHDTDRLASMFVNPDRPYDGANRIQDNGKDYSAAKPSPEQWQRMRQAIAMQMGYVGAPMIYYGDEAGMWSPDDPSNRQPMVFRDLEPYDDPDVKFNVEQFTFYQRAIATRRKLPALQLGYYRPLLADDARNALAFARDLGDQHAYVAINRSASQVVLRVPVADADGTPLIDWLDASHAALTPANRDDATSRAEIEAKATAGYPVRGGFIEVTLPAWGTAILSKRP